MVQIVKSREHFQFSFNFLDEIFFFASGKITFEAFADAMKLSIDDLRDKADRKISIANQRSNRFKGFFWDPNQRNKQSTQEKAEKKKQTKRLVDYRLFWRSKQEQFHPLFASEIDGESLLIDVSLN